MEQYIDGFVFPLPRKNIDEYRTIAEQVAEIWKEYGAIAYYEFLGDDLNLEGTCSFEEAVGLTDDEVVIYGWVVFPSKETRDSANKKVPEDSRMSSLVKPLINPDRLIFDAGRMLYGGFKPLIISE